jgi:Txe/YoeB family toxin of toxin-antitoxin system
MFRQDIIVVDVVRRRSLVETVGREPDPPILRCWCIGKPEPLKGDLSGYWSRRIDDEHRLVYRADDKEVKILKARYHYSD